MRQRCYNTGATGYENYGGRGIRVCARWGDFNRFLEDMGAPPSQDHSLERIDNDKNYEPGNCKWATKREQNRNQRRNHHVIVDGERLLLADAMRMFNIFPHGLYHRIHKFGETRQEAVDHYVRLRRRGN